MIIEMKSLFNISFLKYVNGCEFFTRESIGRKLKKLYSRQYTNGRFEDNTTPKINN